MPYASKGTALRLYKHQDDCGFDDIIRGEFADAFRLSDTHEDGFVAYQDLPIILMRVGHFPRYTLHEFDEIHRGHRVAPPIFKRLEHEVNQLDPEATNQYDFQFFLQLMRRWDDNVNYMGQEEMDHAFAVCDMDRTGFIDAHEIKQMLTVFGENINLKEADKMMDIADMDGNGTINFEEFQHMIMQQTMELGVKPQPGDEGYEEWLARFADKEE